MPARFVIAGWLVERGGLFIPARFIGRVDPHDVTFGGTSVRPGQTPNTATSTSMCRQYTPALLIFCDEQSYRRGFMVGLLRTYSSPFGNVRTMTYLSDV